jgi:hypothetical protein
MRILKHLLLASSSLVGMAGCLPDFSPDPLNSDRAPELDSGTGVDASAAALPSNAGGNPPNAGGDPRDTGTPDAGTPETGTFEASGPTPSDDGGGQMSATDARVDAEPAPTVCNLTGKWLVTERFGMEGLGAKQAAYNWFYVELAQSGNQLTYKKSLSCGANVTGIGIPVIMDDSKAWPAYTRNPAYAGRKGTVDKVSNGCMVHIEKDAVVRGATVAHYRDTNVALPKLAEQATADKPGWEDWDEDGQPAVTLNITSLSSGKLMAVMRNWTEYSGVVTEGARLMSMRLDWGQSRSTLKADNDFLRSDASRDPDQSRTVVEWGRMTDEQAAGDDPTICQSVRDLAKTLTPNASQAK